MDRSKINAYLTAMYLFQFGFLQPINSIVKSQMPIAIFTGLIIFMVLINNRFAIKKYVIKFFLAISTFFILDALIRNNTETILSIYLEFILKGFSAFFIGSILLEGKELYNTYIKFALINFFAIAP